MQDQAEIRSMLPSIQGPVSEGDLVEGQFSNYEETRHGSQAIVAKVERADDSTLCAYLTEPGERFSPYSGQYGWHEVAA
jgi:hypothetical protein